jgi:hypothetical protein
MLWMDEHKKSNDHSVKFFPFFYISTEQLKKRYWENLICKLGTINNKVLLISQVNSKVIKKKYLPNMPFMSNVSKPILLMLATISMMAFHMATGLIIQFLIFSKFFLNYF